MEVASLYDKLVNGNSEIAILGLGYVGLPLAFEFSKKVKVIGFDIDKNRIKTINKGIDINGEIIDFSNRNDRIIFTDNINLIRDAGVYIITVPTPTDKFNNPDLSILKNVTELVSGVIEPGNYIIYESTVYPGVTEDICIPILEKKSGLSYKKDFKVGYSPERINPGDNKHKLSNTVKIVSACDEESLNEIVRIYKLVVSTDIHTVSSIKVAEAAKIIENIQRDVNIALMNEFSILFGRIGIDTYEVLEAAGTKWNFLKFSPGLVGGHCIGIDPYYLVHKARELNYHPQVINAGRFVNDSMGRYVGKQVVKRLVKNGIKIPGAKALILGTTFKENVADIRNSKVFDIVREMQEYGVEVFLSDTYASKIEVKKEVGLEMIENPVKDLSEKNKFDALIIAVAHKEYTGYSESEIQNILDINGVFADLKGIYRNKNLKVSYWSL